MGQWAHLFCIGHLSTRRFIAHRDLKQNKFLPNKHQNLIVASQNISRAYPNNILAKWGNSLSSMPMRMSWLLSMVNGIVCYCYCLCNFVTNYDIVFKFYCPAFCETANPCQNGDCHVIRNNLVCDCDLGYTGEHCETGTFGCSSLHYYTESWGVQKQKQNMLNCKSENKHLNFKNVLH